MIKQTAKELKFELNSMYDACDVTTNYRFWFTQLLSICMGIFKWSNLPESIDGRNIELQLLTTGHCVLYYLKNKLLTSRTTLYDYDAYYQPTHFTYAQPAQGSGDLPLSSPTATIIYNNNLLNSVDGLELDGSLMSYIGYYARQLADISSTINIYAVNSRITDYPTAKNDSVKKSLEKFFDFWKLGKHNIISTDNIILDSFDVKERGHKLTSDTLMNYIDSHDRILENFYRGIGVKFKMNKRAQINVDEVSSDEQLLVISTSDMLKERKKGVDIMNKKFGLNVTVELNEEFNRNSFIEETFQSERGSL